MSATVFQMYTDLVTGSGGTDANIVVVQKDDIAALGHNYTNALFYSG